MNSLLSEIEREIAAYKMERDALSEQGREAEIIAARSHIEALRLDERVQALQQLLANMNGGTDPPG